MTHISYNDNWLSESVINLKQIALANTNFTMHLGGSGVKEPTPIKGSQILNYETQSI